MRWGNNKELIKQNAKDLTNKLKSKLHNNKIDIDYIDEANHSYSGKEEILAEQIYELTKAVDNGAGVLYLYGNYTGDIMNWLCFNKLLKFD